MFSFLGHHNNLYSSAILCSIHCFPSSLQFTFVLLHLLTIKLQLKNYHVVAYNTFVVSAQWVVVPSHTPFQWTAFLLKLLLHVCQLYIWFSVDKNTTLVEYRRLIVVMFTYGLHYAFLHVRYRFVLFFVCTKTFIALFHVVSFWSAFLRT